MDAKKYSDSDSVTARFLKLYAYRARIRSTHNTF